MKNTKPTGNYGEGLASGYLKKLGYKILARNYTIRGGEIDIVALDPDGTLVFVEVKTRFTHDFGLPVESITPWKIKALLKTALFYTQKINWKDGPYRIDLVSVDLINTKPEIELIKNITDF